LKRIIFLIIAAILVLGFVLPGCEGEDGEEEVLVQTTLTFDKGNSTIVVGIPGEATHATGYMALAGAGVAAAEINALGGIHINDDVGGGYHVYNYTTKFVETGEATVSPDGTLGITAMTTNKGLVNFFAGGFRTEAVDRYRDVVMKNDGSGMLFFDCGAATEALCHSVVTNYPEYRFFFKGTPYNEYFLGQSVVRCVDAAARAIRTAAGLNATCNLNATIVADNLAWAFDQVPAITSRLAAIHVTLCGGPYWVDPTGGTGTEMSNLLQNTIAAKKPVFIIPVLSSNAGVFYDIYRNVWVPNALSVGINVLSQLKYPNLARLHNPPGVNQSYSAWEIILDTWGDGVTFTAKTAGFLSGFATAITGIMGYPEYPLYTAATYDVLWAMKGAIEACAVYNTTTLKATADADAIIQWLENPAHAQTSTTGKVMYYPKWDGTTYCGANPALTAAQVAGLYPSAAYVKCDWAMPPHTTHDLVYGPGYLTGLGTQWQWDGVNTWKKVGVWPMVISGLPTDQYGSWSFVYNGTVPIVIPPNVSGNASCS
jgi:hypothetical protein